MVAVSLFPTADDIVTADNNVLVTELESFILYKEVKAGARFDPDKILLEDEVFVP